MTFTQVFGGTTIYPSGVSYRAIALSEDQTLAWPVETATSANVVAQIMDVTPSVDSLSIIMPPANEASVGETALLFNAGSFTFTVKDNGGNTITSIAPGLSYQVYLIGNSTVNGTWRSTQYAAGTSSATAGSLVGYGIKAISTTLNQKLNVTSLNTPPVGGIGDADRASAFVWTGGAGTIDLPSTSSVGNDWFFQIRNGGTGSIVLEPVGSDLINGAANLTFNPGDSAIIICDGTSFFTIGFGQAAAFAFDYVSIDLSSPVTSPYSLAGNNLNRIAYQFGGTLTGNMEVYIPATIQQYWISNDTGGTGTLTVKVQGQTGVVIPRGARAICYCNGTDLVDADTASIAFPLTVAQGGTNATTANGALVNLGGTSVGRAVFTANTPADGRVALTAAASGANSDITSLTGLTTPLSVSQGGTGATALTSGYLVKGNGTSAASVSVVYDNGTNIGVNGVPSAWGGTGRYIQISGMGFVGSSSTTKATEIGVNTYFDGTNWRYATGGYASYYTQSNGSHTWAYALPGTAGNIVSWTTSMVVNSYGALSVVGAISAASASFTAALPVASGGTGVKTLTSGYLLKGNGTSAVSASVIYDTGINIGIGVIPSAWDTSSTGYNVIQLGLASSIASNTLSSSVRLSSNGYNDGTDWRYITTAGFASFRAFGGSFSWSTAASGSAGTTFTPTTILTLGTTGAITSASLADAVGYKGIPQNAQSATYTLALTDMGKHVSITTGGIIIPADSAVAFPVGSEVIIFNNSTSNQTISITTDTLRLAGTGSMGPRTLAQYGVATLLKVAGNVWTISGAGVS